MRVRGVRIQSNMHDHQTSDLSYFWTYTKGMAHVGENRLVRCHKDYNLRRTFGGCPEFSDVKVNDL